MSQTKQTNNTFAGYATIDSCVKSFLMDLGAGMERYEQGKHWILEGYQDFHFDQAQEVKIVQLPLTPWKAVLWPNDYVDWAMLGVVVDQQVRVFTNDNRISLFLPDVDPIDGLPDEREGSNTDPQTTSPTNYYFNSLTSRFEDKGQLYGQAVKGNGQGEFEVNRQRREIQFNLSLDSSTKIYMQYISTGLTVCEKTVVNIYAAKLLKLYAHWCRHKYAKSSNQAEIQRAENDYYRERRLVQGRLSPITAADVIEVARDNYHLAPVY